MNWGEERSTPIAGLDLGTTKVCAVIAEQVAERPLRIIGMGQCPSEGIQRGAIVDAEKTVCAIGEAMRQAELMAGVEIDSVYAGISGEYIASLNSTGMVAIGGEGGWIGTQDRARVLAAAGVVKVPFDREVLHVLPQEFAVNGQRGILEPVGMYGVRLEASVHVVTSSVAAVRNICHSILRAGVEVCSVVLGPLASSYAVLSEDEQQMGVCLLDIGGGTTDVAVFAGKALRHSGIIGLGGQNATNDIGVGLRIARAEAERVKCAGAPSEIVAHIVEARMEEILALARRQVYTALPHVALGAGIVLTGGGSANCRCRSLGRASLWCARASGRPGRARGGRRAGQPAVCYGAGPAPLRSRAPAGEKPKRSAGAGRRLLRLSIRARKKVVTPPGLAAVLAPKIKEEYPWQLG